VYPSSYRPTLILITGATGVATGHFEDKTIVAYCRSEAAIARLFIRVRDRVRSALEHHRIGVVVDGSDVAGWHLCVPVAALHRVAKTAKRSTRAQEGCGVGDLK
jgi:hypothetical protein